MNKKLKLRNSQGIKVQKDITPKEGAVQIEKDAKKMAVVMQLVCW